MDYKNLGIDLAKRAGEIIKQNFVFGMESETKSDGSPVTITDPAINKMVVDDVVKYFPGHSVVGEEQSSVVENAEYAWVCDPVDGTIPFSHGMPICCFSLALTHDGNPILGVAYDPFLDRLCVAEKGQGAFINNKRILVSNKKELKDAYISTGVSRGMAYPMPGFIEDLVFKKEAHLFAMQSVVYNSMLLAAGELDGILFPHHTAHDIAAVKIIVEEAGGKVTDLFGNQQRYDRPIKGAIVSNGLLHQELLDFSGKYLQNKP